MALHDVSLSFELGQVHGLVGQNGAGKSTLLGVLSGRVSPDQGQIYINGSLLRFGDPRASRAAGIACIYQELTMVPNLSACENVFLGQPITRHGRLMQSAMRARFSELCEEFGVKINSRTHTGDLSIAEQQIIEIMRGLQAGAKILLLDEPTAALPESERDRVYSIVATMRASGKTVILVSHKLDEVLTHSQHITVMRNGTIVKSEPTTNWTEGTLIATMVGGAAQLSSISGQRPSVIPGDNDVPLLEAIDLHVPGVLTVPELRVRRGEVLGITGLVGSGRTSLLRALAGLEPRIHGSLAIDGKTVDWPKEPREALRLGIALVPEDRKSAIIGTLSICDNIGIGFSAPGTKKWILTRRHRESYASSHLDGLAFDRKRLGEPIQNLSGGNQQKVLIAKWAGREMNLLLADEPTQGIDVSAKAEVLARLRQLAASGRGVIVVSSEIDEILDVCDRAIVLWRGEVVGEARRGSPAWNHANLLEMSFGKVDTGIGIGT